MLASRVSFDSGFADLYRSAEWLVSGLYRPSAARIWLSSADSEVRPPVPLSRLTTAHSRLPSRLPAPGTAVMFSVTWLRVTTSPSRFRLSGPRTRLSTWQPTAALAARLVFTESVTVWFTVPSEVPLASVSVPLSTPVARSTPFTTLNFCGVNVPLNLPVPSELVNVPLTTEVRCPTDDAGAEATVFPVVAETAAPAEAAVSPVSAITDPAEIAIIFTDGAFIAPSFISGREFDALHVT